MNLNTPLCFLALMCAFPLFAQKLQRDTIAVLPGVGPTVAFERNFDGKIKQVGPEKFICELEKDTIAEPWYFVQDNVVTPPDLFADCIFISPVRQAESRKSPEFFMQKRSDDIYTDRIRWFKSERSSEYRVPASSRYYLDTTKIQFYPNSLIRSDTLTRHIALQYSHPFYFRKTEVTNAEYREFVIWVRDSIAHTRLNHFNANGTINWLEKIDYADSATRDQIGFFLPIHLRFWKRIEVDSRKLIYKFRNRSTEIAFDTLAVYPDTLSWVHDFSFSFNEPMTNMYFWHPAYNTYPVCGVSYWQSMAYLDWLNVKLNNQFAGKGLKINCALPSAAEWDLVSTAENNNGQLQLLGENYNQLCDDSWLTDLVVNSPQGKRSMHVVSPEEKKANLGTDSVITKSRYFTYQINDSRNLRLMLHDAQVMYGNLTIDNGFHTQSVNPAIQKRYFESRKSRGVKNELKTNPYFKVHLDNNGISYLDGNVSEWLRNDVNECWRPIMTKRLNHWSPLMTAEDSIVRSIESLYFRQLPAQGKLVMGGNWFDERFSLANGKNPAGYNAKTFLNPAEQHCTVGFRYVIYVTAAETTTPQPKKQ
ncbi:MAG: SUMF1/EgtB/PvdO family nonheme iron enzyme [Bacteroidia bacterium]|jgi:formylglycine-generating enzyme required for sulfatase activity|nr:SUMF1/EgtB/PvdO family nonheme iron enzyme [Bacteroidia bacterium]